jgi:hypothetical protein
MFFQDSAGRTSVDFIPDDARRKAINSHAKVKLIEGSYIFNRFDLV